MIARIFINRNEVRNNTNLRKQIKVLKKLSEIKLGETATIVSFSDEEIAENLLKMGCIPGEEITMERIAPFNGPVIISVSDYHLSMRKSEAEKVVVEK